MSDFPAIRAVLASYRSTAAHITEAQVQAAWAEYDALAVRCAAPVVPERGQDGRVEADTTLMPPRIPEEAVEKAAVTRVDFRGDLRRIVRAHCVRLWREGRLEVWIEPDVKHDDIEHYRVVFNMQSEWKTLGLRPRSEERGGPFAEALERARESIEERPNCLARRRRRRS